MSADHLRFGRPSSLLAAALIVVAGCESRSGSEGDRSGSEGDSLGAVPILDEVATVRAADMAKLRWIEGDWRGSGGGYDAFYERYTLDGDSVLRQYSFADSTFGQAVDSSAVRLHGDSLFSESGERRYVASALRDTSVTFAPYARALNSFTWRRTSDTTWVAILTPVDTARPRVEYRMVRIRE
jgi:hypothetical protein